MKGTKINISDISDFFKNESKENQQYVDFHKYRYVYLLNLIQEQLNQLPNKTAIKLLDIGPAYQTALIRNYFPDIQVDTLGFAHPASVLRSGEQHFKQDLNVSNKKWAIEGRGYDIIVFCEVIEHLYSKPENSLQKLSNALADHGHIIIQTPNAVAIHKRLRMFLGKNPYNLLEDNKMGHFREYTVKELKTIMENTGLQVTHASLKNYFNSNASAFHRAFVRFEGLIPGPFRDGITMMGTPLNKIIDR